MTQFKTQRSIILNTDNCRRIKATPSMKRVVMAAADYENALRRSEFAECYGGVEALRDDLLQFVRLWYSDRA